MTLLLLGIGSSVCWGTADFFGGLQSRRLPALAVALWSQLAGSLVLLAVLVVLADGGGAPPPSTIAWGLFAGLFGGSALVLFYSGLAVGTMSIVAPVSACGAIVPVLFALATGRVPRGLALAGIAVAIAGVILVSLQREEMARDAGRARRGLLLALGAALGFGLFFVGLDYGSAAGHGAPLWAVGGARLGSLATLTTIVALSRSGAPWPGARAAPIAGVGILDTLANVLFAYASTHGNPGVVAVLGSLYPVMTVVLGRFVLSERLNRVQGAGVAVALAGVVLLSAG